MTYDIQKSKSANDNLKQKSCIITTPDGTEIEITAGRKLQRMRAYSRDKGITDAQFRELFCIVDRLNEGRGDESRWGHAFPDYETLADDTGKDVSSAKRIVKELETGQRKSGSDKKLVSGAPILNVVRLKVGKKDKVNMYSLIDWGAFLVKNKGEAANPPQSDKGEAAPREGEAANPLRVRLPKVKGEAANPDSSHLLTSETHLTYSPQITPACGERGRDDLDDECEGEERDDVHAKAASADQSDDDETARLREGAQKAWAAYPKQPEDERAQFEETFIAMAKAGTIKTSDQVIKAMGRYLRANEPRYYVRPVKFLKDHLRSYDQNVQSKTRMAI